MEKIYNNLEWDRLYRNLGELKEGDRQNPTFTYLGDKTIKAVKGSCGCSPAVLKGNVISIQIKAGNIPTRLKDVGQYHQTNQYTYAISFDDGSKNTLTVYYTTIDKKLK